MQMPDDCFGDGHAGPGQRSMAVAMLLGACAVLAGTASPALAVTLERVSVGPGGVQADADSFLPVISPDGRYVAFGSNATNLVPGDTNGVKDVFLRDRQAGETERVSLGQGDVQGNAISYGVTMSADGRFVAFASYATNLVPGDTNGVHDIFVRDRTAGTTERVNLGPGGAQADADSYWPSISADGRFVAFVSYAQNLAPGSGGAQSNIYLRDRMTGTTTLVPRTGNASGQLLSADGSILAFNTVTDHVFVYDRRTGGIRQVDLTPARGQANGPSFLYALAPGGLNVGFISDATNLVPGDTNGLDDAFVRDLNTGRTVRVSLTADGAQLHTHIEGGMAISAGARFVALGTRAPSLVPGDTNRRIDIFVRAR